LGLLDAAAVRKNRRAGEEIDPAPSGQKKKTNSHDEQKEFKADFRRVFGPLFRRVLGLLDAAAVRKNRRASEEIDPAPSGQKKETNSHDEQKEFKTDFRRVFGSLFRRVLGSLDAAVVHKNRRAVLMIGAAALVLIAVGIGFSSKLRRPAAVPQPALETSSSPGTPAAHAPASTNAQPPAKNTPPAPPTEHDKAQPKREEVVVLSSGPSRISLPQPANSARVGDPAEARDNSALASDAPAIALSDVPASGSLSDLATPVAQPANPQLLTVFEPVTAIKKVPPAYPLVAKLRRLRGSVVVQGTVDKNGRISDLQLISGSPRFRDAAFAAVKQWVFKPAKLNGQAIEHSTTIRLDFGVQ
jgi:protein TonB